MICALMRDTMWFKALAGGTFARIYRKHLRWFRPNRPENDDARKDAK